MKNEIIFKKVLAKLEFEKEAGITDYLKKILVGIGLLGSIYSPEAMGKAGDVSKALKDLDHDFKRIQQKEEGPKLEFKIINFSPLNKTKDGKGSFVMKYGPFNIKGDFFSAGGAKDSEVRWSVDKESDKDQIEALKPTAKLYFDSIQKLVKSVNEAK